MFASLQAGVTQQIGPTPARIGEAPSAIAAFAGYTARADWRGRDLSGQPTRIGSLFDYEQRFGSAPRPARLRVTLDSANRPTQIELQLRYLLHAALQLYFANGGGPCYIVSVGTYQAKGKLSAGDLERGIQTLAAVKPVTLLLCPDAVRLGAEELAKVQRALLRQSATLRNRFALLDLRDTHPQAAAAAEFRQLIGDRDLAFGAAYTPHLLSRFAAEFDPADLQLLRNGVSVSLAAITRQAGIAVASLDAWQQAAQRQRHPAAGSTESLQQCLQALERSNPIYAGIAHAIRAAGVRVPPSGAIAGVYARVDRDRGVWNAPANRALVEVKGVTTPIDNATQRALTLDPQSGKSINAIRAFDGRGVLVWGARTLAGNDPAWRYIPARRSGNQIERTLLEATAWAVFEPNDANLWQPLRAQIDRYLSQKWRAGGLHGRKPSEAFYVRIGLGSSMSSEDLAAGRLIIDLGLALVRPAEFAPLRIVHQLRSP